MFGLWRQVCDKLASSWRVPVEVLGFLKRVRARMLQGLASVFKYSRGIEGLVECCQCTTRTWTQRGFCDCATEKSFKNLCAPSACSAEIFLAPSPVGRAPSTLLVAPGGVVIEATRG